MTTPVVSTAPITDIRRIAAVMLDHGVDGVPITNERDGWSDSSRVAKFSAPSSSIRR